MKYAFYIINGAIIYTGIQSIFSGNIKWIILSAFTFLVFNILIGIFAMLKSGSDADDMMESCFDVATKKEKSERIN